MDMLVEGDGPAAIVAFTAFGSHGGGFQWRSLLADIPVRKVLLMDTSQVWYLGDVEGMAAEIRTAVRGRPFFTLGSSMGGFAALLYGAIVGADKAIAFAPQTTMHREHLVQLNNLEWPDSVAAIERLGGRYRDCAPYVLGTRLPTNVYLDPKVKQDVGHAARIAAPHVEVGHIDGGHECALHFARSGKMRVLISDALCEMNVETQLGV